MLVSEEEAASQAITALVTSSAERDQAKFKIAKILASDDAFVDIHELFRLYNGLYFRSLLLPRVEISWSPRLTLCAGICELIRNPDDGNKFTRIRLKLSEPLLQYRPRSDVVNTLLHEAIHAYFFITTTWRRRNGNEAVADDTDADHGAGFLLLADAINNHGGYDITVYHTFHDEVDSFRTHIWQCDGPCRLQAPNFGLVKRAMNRPPGKSDLWWKEHQETCGGAFTKIAEPELSKKQIEKLPGLKRAGLQKSKIDAWVKGESKESTEVPKVPSGDLAPATAGVKRNRAAPESELVEPPLKKPSRSVSCPICNEDIEMHEINQHLDDNHPT